MRLNRAARDLVGKPFGATVGAPLPASSSEPVTTVARLAAEACATGRTATARIGDVQNRTWEITASPSRRDAPAPTGAIALMRDVSVSESLQASLRRSERMSAMGALVAGVAHEVRNPLFAISATLDAFESEFSEHEDFREYSDLLRAEVERLSHLMKELLEYGRPTAAELEPGSIREVVQRGVQSCERQAAASGIALAQDLELSGATMPVDAARMVQVVQNVVQNAIDHSPRGSGVRVSAREVDGGVELQVQDEGPGFAEGDLERIFDPFFTRRRAGTGLGLSIVQRIVQDHGGEVIPANRSDGPGAVVTIRLPCHREEAGG
jgi:signal transduction histidine kinase